MTWIAQKCSEIAYKPMILSFGLKYQKDKNLTTLSYEWVPAVFVALCRSAY